jgi:hypothetical protein
VNARIAPGAGSLRIALASAALGILISLALLVKETPYTLVAFMFLGQPLLLLGFILLGVHVFRDLRARGIL